MSLATIARRARLAIVRHQLQHAEDRRSETGPDSYGDALIARLRRQQLILRGRLLLSVKSIHAKRDLIVCAAVFLAAPPAIVMHLMEVAA
ncbi:hypothetical protein [Pseudothauera rhizosphaerae]|uniref:Uncharacterized protein n=1 Tax=Pseudothauera rhizosphaerae TaxID=2565932 RepID=A0A4S4A7E9_9RHOO|nr:hypothetical protein [Pseudothauera rhizosphaerae]THF54657.1 hypothetical protein E6O51_21575 [Pseudothauera rhizosphaerae]